MFFRLSQFSRLRCFLVFRFSWLFSILHTITTQSINLTVAVISPKGWLLSLLLEADLLLSFLLGAGLLIVFNIEVSEAAIYWSLRWIANKNWQSWEKLGSPVQTLVQAISWPLWFALLPYLFLWIILHIWGNKPHLDENDISLGWQKESISRIGLESSAQP